MNLNILFLSILTITMVISSYAQSFESKTNFVGGDITKLKGQKLEVLGKSEKSKCYGYDNFFKSKKIVEEKYASSNSKLVYKQGAECSKSNSKYEALVNKVFKVTDIIIENGNSFLELTNEEEILYFLYDKKYEFNFPFLVVEFYEQFKKTINERNLTDIIDFNDKYSTYSKIVDTEIIDTKINSFDKSEIENIKLIQSLMVKSDEFTGVTWVSLQPYRYNKLKISIHPYISINGDNVSMRLGITYSSKDWLFIDKIYLLVDGDVKNFNIKSSDIKRETVRGGIIEMIDISLVDDDIIFLNKLVDGNNTKMKLSGKYSEINIITDNEKKDAKDILKAYKILQNNLEIVK